jgi:hypothetical protein
VARKNKRVKPDQLAPRIAEGFTDTPMTPEEARREFPVHRPERMRLDHMTRERGRGEPFAAMVLVPMDVIIEEPNTGRMFKDVKQIVTEQEAGEIEAGIRCLRCKEPWGSENPLPEICPVCTYEARKRQMIDCAAEMVGTEHIGPSRPLGQFMEDLEIEHRKREFESKVQSGFKGSKRVPRSF